MCKYETKCWGEEYTIEGDFTEASCPVRFCGEPTPYQVADFQHHPSAAMRRMLEDMALASGDDPDDDDDVREEIDDAIEAMR